MILQFKFSKKSRSFFSLYVADCLQMIQFDIWLSYNLPDPKYNLNENWYYSILIARLISRSSDILLIMTNMFETFNERNPKFCMKL